MKILKFDYGKIHKDKQEVLEVDRKTSLILLIILAIFTFISIILNNENILIISFVVLALEVYFLRKWKSSYKILYEEFNKVEKRVKTKYNNS